MQQTKIRRVLLVSRIYPPMHNARAIQAERVVKALRNENVDVRVVSEYMDSAERGRQEKIGPHFFREIRAKYRRFVSDIGLFCNKSEVAWRGVGQSLKQTLSDGWLPDCVLSMSVPFASHLVGYEIAKKLGVPWSVFMSDPYPIWIAPGPYSKTTKLYGMRKKNYAATLLAKCDAVLVPSTEMSEQLRVTYPVLEGIPLIETLHCASVDREPGETSVSSSIYHIGQITSERCSNALIDAIKSMAETLNGRQDVLVFVGPVASVLRNALSNEAKNGFVRFEPPVDSERSREVMRSAKALLLIEADMNSGPFLPSKLTDYAAAGRPMLIISNQDSAVVRVASGHEGVYCASHNRDLILKALLSIYEEPGHLSAELAAKFSPKAVANRYMDGLRLAADHYASRSHHERGSSFE